MAYATRELSVRTYPDFERLATKQGGCWCTYCQRDRPVRRKMSREARKQVNRKYKGKLVREGHAHAELVYDGEIPVGRCQYGTQDELPMIDEWRNSVRRAAAAESSSITSKEKLWRITCFFVDRNYRGRGVARAGLRATLSSIQNRGGRVVEAYPVVSKKMAAVPEWRWFGTPACSRKRDSAG